MKKYNMIFNHFLIRFTFMCFIILSLSFLALSASKNESAKALPEMKTRWVYPKVDLSDTNQAEKNNIQESMRIDFAPVSDENGDYLFIASRKAIFKINSTDGTEIKRKKLGQPPSVPLVYERLRIFICDKRNTVFCLDADLNEKAIWSTKFEFKSCISIQITSNGLLCAFTDGTIILLGLEQGVVLWQCSIGDEISHPPAIDEQNSRFYVIGSKGSLYRIKLKNGTFVKNAAFEQKPMSAPIFFDNKLFISFENGKFIAFDPEQLENDWELSLINDIVAPAVGIEDLVCFNTLSNQVFCYDKDSGTLEGRFRGKQRFYLPPLIHDKLIFAFGYHNGILAGNIENGKSIGWIEHIGKPTTPALDLSEKKILILVLDNNRLEALDYTAVVQSQLVDE